MSALEEEVKRSLPFIERTMSSYKFTNCNVIPESVVVQFKDKSFLPAVEDIFSP